MAMINNVNHKNMIIMSNFLKRYAEENGLQEYDVNIFEMLKLPFPEKYKNALNYYTDPRQWSPLETYVQCYLKTKEITGDPNTFRNCGRSTVKYKSFDNWRQVGRSLSGPTAAINILPNIFPDWNDTKTFEIVEPPHFDMRSQEVKATFRYKFHQHIDPCDDYCSDPHILGIFEAMPTNYPRHIYKPWDKLPMGNVVQPMVQYDPVKLFSGIFFKHLELTPFFDGNLLYIKNPNSGLIEKVGRKVILIPSELNGQKIYLGQYRDITEAINEEESFGTLILKTIIVRGEPVCEAGIIMGGPYFLIHYSCQELAVTRKLMFLKCLLIGKNKLLEEIFKINDVLRIEIDEKNKAFEKIREYADHLEEMVQKRTAELSEAQMKLIEADKLKSIFFANVSHEVRTPLTLLISPIESILQGDYTGSIDDKFFKGLHRNAVRLLELLNSMLDFAKIEAGKMAMKITQVEVVQMIKNWIGTIHSACEMRDVSLSFISLNKSVDLWIDINKFEKIVMNLFSNSLKFTEKGGKIVVRIKDDNKNCYFELEDTGFGIQQDKINSIFDRFYQVDSDSSNKFEGTGIGLALVKEYIEMHGGSISVESKCKEENPHDHGTIFYITIPKGKEHFEGKQGVVFVDKVLDESIADSWLIRMGSLIDMHAEPNDAAEPQISISKLKGLPNILIVEDNLEMRNYFKMLLKNNYNINIAVNGQEGLNLANQLQPDLIITDVMMPIMNGYEMTRLIKTNETLKRIPIIMITAKSEIANKIEGLEHGADDYITKPFNSKELVTRVKNLLQLSYLQQELIHLNKNLQGKVKEQTDRIAKREKLKGYLPPQLVESILNGSDSVCFANERRKLTIFFSDIQGFTTATENLEAEDLSRILNEYFTVMTNIAHKWGGTVDKFIGDGIMIVFGAPTVTDEKDHALRCVKMAIEMQQFMKQLQEKWFQSGLEFCPLIRIGINTGIATVGNFGTEERLSYTAVGGQVNLASRLESICEPGGILISHSTWALVKDEIGYKNERTVEIKDIHRKVLVYDVVW